MGKIKTKQAKDISFTKLTRQAIPEILGYTVLTNLILSFGGSLIYRGAEALIFTRAVALTSANYKSVLLSPQGFLLLLLGAVYVLLFIVIEIFSLIYFSDDILSGREAKIRSALVRGFRAVPRFLNPSGILILLYIFIAVPLCGLGFGISITKSFSVPDFIMEVINKTPVYEGLYITAVVVLFILGFRSLFSVHEVLLHDITPKEARKNSVSLMKQHWGCIDYSGRDSFWDSGGILDGSGGSVSERTKPDGSVARIWRDGFGGMDQSLFISGIMCICRGDC